MNFNFIEEIRRIIIMIVFTWMVRSVQIQLVSSILMLVGWPRQAIERCDLCFSAAPHSTRICLAEIRRTRLWFRTDRHRCARVSYDLWMIGRREIDEKIIIIYWWISVYSTVWWFWCDRHAHSTPKISLQSNRCCSSQINWIFDIKAETAIGIASQHVVECNESTVKRPWELFSAVVCNWTVK